MGSKKGKRKSRSKGARVPDQAVEVVGELPPPPDVSGDYDQAYYRGATKSAYDDYWNCKGVLNDLAFMVARHFRPESFFDAGAAYGFAVEWYQARDVPARGCDVSEWCVAQAGGRIYQHDLRVPPIPEEDRSWDVVTCNECIEHLHEPYVERAIRDMHRIASRRLVMLIDIALTPEGVDQPDPGDCTHVTLKLKEWWEQKFEEWGFERDLDGERLLNGDPVSVRMSWAGRWFILKA